jgi:hypothetical protein
MLLSIYRIITALEIRVKSYTINTTVKDHGQLCMEPGSETNRAET